MPEQTAVKIVTGYTGEPHVTAAQEGRRNAGTFGTGRYVLDSGMGSRGLAVTVESANAVTIGPGDGIMDGRHVTVEGGTTLTIASGTQGRSRDDLVCMHYAVNLTTGVESMELVVLQGSETTGTPSLPDWGDGSILNNATEAYWPLWRLRIRNTSLVAPSDDPYPNGDRMFERLDTLAALAQLLASHTHDARHITSGALAIARGGTGLGSVGGDRVGQVFCTPASLPDGATGAPSFRTLVPSDIPSLPATKIGDGQLAVARGGTGLGQSPSMRVNLASDESADVMQASPAPGVDGVLPIAHGGTGASGTAAALKSLGIAYAPGDSFSSTIRTAGFVTNSGKEISFTIPAVRVCNGTPRLNYCRLSVRQNGNYIVGSGSGLVEVSANTSISFRSHGYHVVVSLARADSHTLNNDTVGINCEYSIRIQ